MKQLSILFAIVLAPIIGLSQSKSSIKNPVDARLLLMQKGYGAPELTVSKQAMRFNGQNSHSIGIGAGADFWLSPYDKNQPIHWVLQSTLYLQTVPIKFSATLPKEHHRFDRDVDFSLIKYAAGLEANMGLVRKSQINETLTFRLGLSMGIQQFYINQRMFSQSVRVIRDKVTSTVEVAGVDFFGGGFTPPVTVERSEQNLAFTPIINVGLEKELPNYRHFIIDFRFCMTETVNSEIYPFRLGSTGNFISKKAFIGLDLGYMLWMNKGLSRPGF